VELALYRKQLGLGSKAFLVLLLLVCFILLIPSTVVFAQAIDGRIVVSMNGVNNSDIEIGAGNKPLISSGSSPNGLLIIDPPSFSSPVSQIVSLLPFLFIAFAIFLIILMFIKGRLDIKLIILVAVTIYIAIALLTGMQGQINGLLGG